MRVHSFHIFLLLQLLINAIVRRRALSIISYVVVVFGINKENLEAIRSGLYPGHTFSIASFLTPFMKVLGNEGSFVEYAFEFLRMEKEVRLSLDQKASTKSHGLIAFGQIENVPFLDQKIDPSVPHNVCIPTFKYFLHRN